MPIASATGASLQNKSEIQISAQIRKKNIIARRRARTGISKEVMQKFLCKKLNLFSYCLQIEIELSKLHSRTEYGLRNKLVGNYVLMHTIFRSFCYFIGAFFFQIFVQAEFPCLGTWSSHRQFMSFSKVLHLKCSRSMNYNVRSLVLTFLISSLWLESSTKECLDAFFSHALPEP